MSSPTEAVLPASRLRVGDALPTYGDHATITRPPVISVDGAMVSVLVASTDDDARLVRIPVDQPVPVRRPTGTTDTFVRRTRTAQSSGARILVLDLTHPDSEIQPLDAQPYATWCVPHHSIRFHSAVSTAEARASHPEEWCEPCAQATQARARHRVYGGTERKLA